MLLCSFDPIITGGPYVVTIDETQALLEEVVKVTAKDNDTSSPNNEFVFELTSNNQWFDVDEDGKIYVKRVSQPNSPCVSWNQV